MAHSFSSPPRVLLGDDALTQLAAELPRLGTKVLVVTDPGVKAAGLLDQVTAALATSVPVTVFAEVAGNPDVDTVDAAAEQGGADALSPRRRRRPCRICLNWRKPKTTPRLSA